MKRWVVTPSRLDGRDVHGINASGHRRDGPWPRFFRQETFETLAAAMARKAFVERQPPEGVWVAYINEATVVDGVLVIGKQVEHGEENMGVGVVPESTGGAGEPDRGD